MSSEIFGAGKDWLVYQDPENDDLLIKEAKNPNIESPKRIMQRLALGKILHILFPHSIPDIYPAPVEGGGKIKSAKNYS